jgi:hypothetical protein
MTLALSPKKRKREKMFKVYISEKLGSMPREPELTGVEEPEQKKRDPLNAQNSLATPLTFRPSKCHLATTKQVQKHLYK